VTNSWRHSCNKKRRYCWQTMRCGRTSVMQLFCDSKSYCQ